MKLEIGKIYRNISKYHKQPFILKIIENDDIIDLPKIQGNPIGRGILLFNCNQYEVGEIIYIHEDEITEEL